MIAIPPASGLKSPVKEFRPTLVRRGSVSATKIGDAYAEFLPPAVLTDKDGEAEYLRAVVIISEETTKGTRRSGQEYVNPLLTLSGREYANVPFRDLHDRICDALRGNRRAVTMETFGADGEIKIYFEDGTFRPVNRIKS